MHLCVDLSVHPPTTAECFKLCASMDTLTHADAGMVAPRGLLVIENTGMVWLGNQSCWGNSVAGHTVFQALQVDDHMGVSQVGVYGGG